MENTLNIMWVAGSPSETSAFSDTQERRLFRYFDLNYLEWLPHDKNCTVLDFGCGSGVFLRYLKTRGFLKLTGFDPDRRFSHFASENLNIPILQSEDPLAYLRDQISKFDLVICRQVAYYFPRAEIHHWFEALSKTLKPGGRLLIEVFNGALLTSPWVFQKDNFIKFVFTEPLLQNLIKESGLKTVFFGGDKIPCSNVKMALWLALRHLWGGFLRLIYFLERGLDHTNPRFFTKNLIAIAERP